jgi:VanZ family protein
MARASSHSLKRNLHMNLNSSRSLPIWRGAFAVYLAILALIIVLAYLGLIPTEIAYIPYYDTIGHFALLGIASYLLHRALDRRAWPIGNIRVPAGPLIVAAVALVEESAQSLSPIRTFSLFDYAADLVGIWGAYWLDLHLRQRR